MRPRTILFLALCTYLVYRVLPASKRGAMRDRLTAFGQALVLSLVLFWVWMLLGALWDAWRSAG